MNQKLSNALFIIGTAILLILFFLIIFIFAPNRKTKICNAVNVEVVDEDDYCFISAEDVEKEMEEMGIDLIGLELGEVDLEKIENKIEEHEMLRRAVCFQNKNGDISIEVQQRVPVFRVMTSGETYYIDNERKKMPVSLRHAAYVPLVSGNVNFEFASLQLYDFIVFLQNDNFMASLIEQIYIDENGDVEIIPRVGNLKIKLGSLERYENKIAKLKKFYKKVLPKVGWDKYKYVNLEFEDRVVAS